VADLLLLGFPLGAAALLMSLNTNLPRYFVDHWRGKADLGVYSAMAALITAGTMLTKSLNQSSAARMARIWNSGDRREFSRLLARLLGTGCLTGAAGLLAAGFWSRELLTLLFRREYAAYPAAFLGIMTAAWLSYLVGTVETALFAVRALGVQLPLRIASSLATLAGCTLFVPAWGETGAAWALVVGRLPVAVLGLMVLARTVFGEGRSDGGAAAGVDLPRPHWSTAVPVSAVGGAAAACTRPAGEFGSRGET
jgi:O-antigen/teichoic acid export membrane protein